MIPLLCFVLGYPFYQAAFVINLTDDDVHVSHLRTKLASLLKRPYQDVSIYKVLEKIHVNDNRISLESIESARLKGVGGGMKYYPQSIVPCMPLENPMATISKLFVDETAADVKEGGVSDVVHIFVVLEDSDLPPPLDETSPHLLVTRLYRAVTEGGDDDERREDDDDNDFLVLPPLSAEVIFKNSETSLEKRGALTTISEESNTIPEGSEACTSSASAAAA
ncbi:hypothetical protein HDU97_001792 [Phlyctochytrium planicorne]|nr:hypothetical protein HDU97_001792 [Phlyctochytrium planicorne]